MDPKTMLPVFDFETGLISTEPASGSICMETMRVSISLPLDALGSGNIVAAVQIMATVIYFCMYKL